MIALSPAAILEASDLGMSRADVKNERERVRTLYCGRWYEQPHRVG